MNTLFDIAIDLGTHRTSIEAVSPPDLSQFSELVLDFETDGVRWYRGSKPVGFGYYLPDGSSGYVAWAQRGGGNSTDWPTVERWFNTALVGKRITNAGILFDEHMARNAGTSLSGRGNVLSDVQHYAALLDDWRRQFNLGLLCRDFLGDEEKVTVVNGHSLDPTRMADYHASMVAPRAIADCRQAWKLKQVMWPRLTEEGLHRVRELEDRVIPVVCEMERNALPIDRELLDRWVVECEQEYLRLLYTIAREVGFQVSPGRGKDVKRLFEHLKIPITEFTEPTVSHPLGQPSFTDAVLKDIDHPTIKKLYRAAKLEDLQSKAFEPFKRCVDADPEHVLRFALHQLRSDDGGTITGRFSSSKLQRTDNTSGVNAQQVMAVEKQQKVYGDDFIVRKLVKAPPGRKVVSADAKQIEYRIFASEANNPRIIEAYRQNPDLSFHEETWETFKPYCNITYKQQKNLNFMKIYGGGLAKLSFMLGHITEKQLTRLQIEYTRGVPRDHPLLKEALKVASIYDRLLPEVGPLLRRYSERAQRDGFVTTITGRRTRLKDRFYKAFNGFDQGSAADIMKQKMVELDEVKNEIGLIMRCSIHDEFLGDVDEDSNSANVVKDVLNRQSFPELKIPILWDVKIGNNWAELKKLDHQFDGTVLDRTRSNSGSVRTA